MNYRQITAAERYTLGLLRRQGLTAAAIARLLGRHRSTIGREVRRNRTHHDGGYRPQLADWYARGRRSHSRRNTRFTATDWAEVERLVREDWSPEQIAGRLAADGHLAISFHLGEGLNPSPLGEEKVRVTWSCAKLSDWSAHEDGPVGALGVGSEVSEAGADRGLGHSCARPDPANRDGA